MKIEHFAINVANPVEMAQWYETHLGMRIIKSANTAPYTHFLADESGNSLIEIYNNPANEVPNYAKMNPLIIHLAFVSTDVTGDIKRLTQAGATLVEEVLPGDGTHLAMMRDPWGLAIQFCKRANPMLKCQQ
jgi:catechol 2,3-dioxygenase-like lactoylglutathione lyase family enzyme